MAKWKKTSSYGDYRDPLQNHKFDTIVTNKEEDIILAENKHSSLIRQARWYYGKHIGSKKKTNLLNFISKGSNIRKILKTFKKKTGEDKPNTSEQITDAEVIAEVKNN